jgi:hypothetical protein
MSLYPYPIIIIYAIKALAICFVSDPNTVFYGIFPIPIQIQLLLTVLYRIQRMEKKIQF